jgi:hypothetical protein
LEVFSIIKGYYTDRDEVNIFLEEALRHFSNCFTENIIADFSESDQPQTHRAMSAYLNSLFAMHYHLYLACRKNLDQQTALNIPISPTPYILTWRKSNTNSLKAAKPIKLIRKVSNKF